MQHRFFAGIVAVFLFVGTVWGQYQPNPAGMPPVQQQSNQQAPLQTPPKSITLNGMPVQPNDAAQRTQTPGFGSPYPTGTQAAENPGNGGYYLAQPRERAPQTSPQGTNPAGAPMYVAQANPIVAGNPAPQPNTVPLDGRQHIGRAEPEFRVVPFVLTPDEQKELDEFLTRWEGFGAGIKRYDVEFTLYEYDPTIDPTSTKPAYTAYGEFKYVTPNRFVYHVKGQWIDGEQVKGGPLEEKTIIDGTSIFEYIFKTTTVKQYKIAPELLERGFADSPLPLIFGAKADEMRKRFSMKIVTHPDHKGTQVWLAVKPMLLADQEEFLGLEIRIDKKTLRATALKKDNINGKAHTVYVLKDPKINSPFDLTIFKRDVPRDWTLEIVDRSPVLQAQPQPARPLDPIGNSFPPPNNNPPVANPNEIKLY